MASSSQKGGAVSSIRLVSHLFGLTAVGAISCAIYLFALSRVEKPLVVVEEPNRVLTHLIPGRDYEIAFRIHNRTEQSLRILGMGIT